MRLSPHGIALAVAVAVGAGIGAGVASFGHVRYEAQASVLVSAKGGAAAVAPLLPNVREIATSSVLAGDVHSTLRLPGSAESLRKAIRASTPPNTQLVVVSFTNRHRTRAQQVAQEIAVKLTQLVPARFGKSTQALKVTIFDQAHIVRRSSPDFLGDALIGAAIGLVLALSGIAATLRRPEVAVARADGALTDRERRLEERIAAVSARETALARRAGELAQRERALEAAGVAPPPVVVRAEPEPVPEPAPLPEPEPVFEPVPGPAPVAVAEGPAARTLTDLERLVRTNAERFPDAVDEWNAYLFYLRDYADASGRLPASFDALIEDVFGVLVPA